MEVTFDKDYLSELYHEGKCSDKKHRFQPQIIRGYIKAINALKSARIIEDLYRVKSLHYEMLVGDKNGIESVKVNNQYRVEFTSKKIVEETIITICNILELSNHYK